MSAMAIQPCVILNPASQRNRKQRQRFLEEIQRYPALRWVELHDFAELPQILRDLLKAGINCLIVAGGDGTVHGVLTALFNETTFQTLPILAVIPSGMTNLIALELGMGSRPILALRRVMARLEAARPGERLCDMQRVLSLSLNNGAPSLYGMFMGGGAFYDATMITRRQIHGLGLRHSVAAFVAIVTSLIRALRGRNESGSLLYRGHAMQLTFDGQPGEDGLHFVFLATTLRRLLFGINPFWGEGVGVRYLSIRFPPSRFLAAIWPILRGRPKPWMLDKGYSSAVVTELQIETESPFMLDGEVVVPHSGQLVTIRGDREIPVLRFS